MREEKIYYVYILASSKNGTLYVGVTNDLQGRVLEHRGILPTSARSKGSFAQKYKVSKLVYFEEFGYIGDAIHREKCIKKWNRAWKLRLIEKDNPGWEGLYEKTVGGNYC